MYNTYYICTGNVCIIGFMLIYYLYNIQCIHNIQTVVQIINICGRMYYDVQNTAQAFKERQHIIIISYFMRKKIYIYIHILSKKCICIFLLFLFVSLITIYHTYIGIVLFTYFALQYTSDSVCSLSLQIYNIIDRYSNTYIIIRISYVRN